MSGAGPTGGSSTTGSQGGPGASTPASLVVAEAASRRALGDGFEAALVFADMLRVHGEERGLIGPRELDRLWTRHIVNSAAVLPHLPRSGRVADVGSGAGLPGVVLAAARPDLEFHLVEPMERRIAWLELVATTIGLTNVTLHQKQAQELHGSLQFDAVTARAVAALDKLLRWTWPLVAPGGALVAMKGARAADELTAASSVLKKLPGAGAGVVHEVDVLGDGDVTRVVEVRRS
ncbi:16S rRNA (guanine(527)-N(7))-methyltransferase RsmG [Litorihabitans aurantiacus]|uniref:Ribosomal RNA small subunit methyltransferase G n=1 Tax=Litorihabitans aurantiacus TaxID=1930061 RepID=A0AA38CRT4_9MICO|nr:16S rRNA (guanine(527)-N(7))-methyltransferase RsmG [Litorihabitans aurantiacus]GMA33083.1 ribosomal RNA small subunit methyltransferase G [Litorihabitans aurantiacus]